MQEHGFAPEQALYVGVIVHDCGIVCDLGVDCILFSGGQQSSKLLQNCGVPVCDDFIGVANQLKVEV